MDKRCAINTSSYELVVDYHEFDNTVSHFCSILTTVACMCDINDFHFYCRIIVGPTVIYSYTPVFVQACWLKPGVHTNDFAPIHGRRACIHTAPAESTVDSTYCLPQALCEYGRADRESGRNR